MTPNEDKQNNDTFDENINPEISNPQHSFQEESFWDKAKGHLEKCREESSKFIKVGKLKWDQTTLQQRKTTLLKQLGSQTFTMLEEGNFEAENLSSIIEEIKSLDEKLQEFQSGISDITDPKIAS